MSGLSDLDPACSSQLRHLLGGAINQRTVQGTRYNTATQAEIDTEEFRQQ